MTTPPLDLPALKEDLVYAQGHPSPWEIVDPDHLAEAIERAEAAEASMEAVQEAWDEYKAKLGGGIPDYYKNRIEGALAGHWLTLGGTPTGELADVCSCGKSYWPCDSLDGGA